ncbi:dihydrofolate reductase [Jeotgalibaca sp. A127]|uniref:dihydrofolate reductase n=1 Tax=Jeotgalibaca sp. A127 TaxID=3457324 RepID=UPI003FD1AD5B
MYVLVWAEDDAGAIGKDGKLPWHLPNDLKFFKTTTNGQTIVMGRKTFESMGSRPLPNRKNYVLTRQNDYEAPGAVVINSLNALPDEDIYVIGGSEIYKKFLPEADVLIRTKISGTFDGDTFFPEVNWDEWELVEETEGTVDEKNKYAHRFQTFKRK